MAMTAIHFPKDAPAKEVADCVKEHGYAIVDRLVDTSIMDRIEAELDPYTVDVPFADDEFLGKRTKRTGALVARSETCRDVIMNPFVLEVAKQVVSKASTIQLQLTQVVELSPGSPSQMLHQDELAWDMFPMPSDYHAQCNTLWAMTDYTEEMGATRIVPDSQNAGRDAKLSEADTIPAIMDRGSALIYTGKVYHGSGHNRSNVVRKALNINYCAGWLRQEENQYLACPIDVARKLPDDLLKLMGYQCGAFALGYIRDYEDPMKALFDNGDKKIMGAAAYEEASAFFLGH